MDKDNIASYMYVAIADIIKYVSLNAGFKMAPEKTYIRCAN